MNILDWARTLLSDKYEVLTIINVFEKPYSKLYKINTTEGVLYLKQNNEIFNYEHKVTKYLHEINSENNLEILFSNDSLNAFIMKDLGLSLSEKLKESYSFKLIESSLINYGKIQQKVNIQVLKTIGIRDLSIESLEKKFFDLLLSGNFSIKQDTLKDILNLRESISLDINEILSIGIKNSIEHGDFHLGNILVNNKENIIYIDWAEATITNPLFSLISFNYSLVRRLGLNIEDKPFLDLNNQYLNSFAKHYQIEYDMIEKSYFLSKKIYHLYYILTMKDIMVFDLQREDWKYRIEHSLNDIVNNYK